MDGPAFYPPVGRIVGRRRVPLRVVPAPEVVVWGPSVEVLPSSVQSPVMVKVRGGIVKGGTRRCVSTEITFHSIPWRLYSLVTNGSKVNPGITKSGITNSWSLAQVVGSAPWVGSAVGVATEVVRVLVPKGKPLPNGKSNGKLGPNCGMALAVAASKASLVIFALMVTELTVDEIRNKAGKSRRKPREAGEYAGDV